VFKQHFRIVEAARDETLRQAVMHPFNLFLAERRNDAFPNAIVVQLQGRAAAVQKLRRSQERDDRLGIGFKPARPQYDFDGYRMGRNRERLQSGTRIAGKPPPGTRRECRCARPVSGWR
jgi:hypothetical protein